MCQLRTSPPKCLRACPCVRVILVLVCKTLILVLVWGTYYVPATYIPKKKLARTCVRTWYQHVCIWYQPAPKIRTIMYIRMYQGYIQPKKTKHNAQQTLRVPHTHSTRATSKNKKGTERLAHAHGATHAQGSSAI